MICTYHTMTIHSTMHTVNRGYMDFVTSTQARNILKVKDPETGKKKPIDWRTFTKMMKKVGIKPAFTTPQGTHLYKIKQIKELALKLPNIRKKGIPLI